MDDYLIDRETLGRFVDELIKKKALPAENVGELNQLREDSIRALDAKITDALFGGMTKEQGERLNQLLDQDDGTPDRYQQFFLEEGIDVEKTMTNAAQAFAAEFLGGENA